MKWSTATAQRCFRAYWAKQSSDSPYAVSSDSHAASCFAFGATVFAPSLSHEAAAALLHPVVTRPARSLRRHVYPERTLNLGPTWQGWPPRSSRRFLRTSGSRAHSAAVTFGRDVVTRAASPRWPYGDASLGWASTLAAQDPGRTARASEGMDHRVIPQADDPIARPDQEEDRVLRRVSFRVASWSRLSCFFFLLTGTPNTGFTCNPWGTPAFTNTAGRPSKFHVSFIFLFACGCSAVLVCAAAYGSGVREKKGIRLEQPKQFGVRVLVVRPQTNLL